MPCVHRRQAALQQLDVQERLVQPTPEEGLHWGQRYVKLLHERPFVVPERMLSISSRLRRVAVSRVMKPDVS